jgi:hypothetical protein
MGLFSMFKTKELSPEDQFYQSVVMGFYENFKKRHGFIEGWHQINLVKNEIILSFNELPDLKDLALQLNPRPPAFIKKGEPADILIDLSLPNKKSIQECQQTVRELSRPLTFLTTSFAPAQILSDDQTCLPRISKHGAGMTGFWLWLPLPTNGFENVAAFDEVTAWILEVARRLAN